MDNRRAEQSRLSMPDGGSLQAYLSFAGEPAPWALVFVHGFGSTRSGEKAEALEKACARRGWTFASFDFRGHGGSSGTLLELRGTGLLEDIAALQDHLIARGVRRLGLVGSSMGGWASAWFAARHPDSIIGCVLIAPALDFLRCRWAGLSEADLR